MNVLEEALEICTGDRARDYGPPIADALRFAHIASEVTGLPIRPEHFPLLMIAVKLSRQANRPKRDNLVDIAGYAYVAEKIQEVLKDG